MKRLNNKLKDQEFKAKIFSKKQIILLKIAQEKKKIKKVIK